MRFSPILLAGLLLTATNSALFAQLQIKLSQDRTVYLLYEPMEFTVSLTNTTDESIVLSRDPGSDEDWLNFMIFTVNKEKIHSENTLTVPASTIPPGETLKVPINVTPYFAIRSTGSYTVQAVVNIPGRRPLLTSELYFSVGKGDVVWKKELYNEGTKRVYSLIRFLENNDSNLYLRVEDPDINTVYTTIRLGKLTAYADPVVEFDKDQNIHIVHTVGAKTSRYTMANSKGKILKQEDRTVGDTKPTLAKAADGTVQLVGGIIPQEKKVRPKLSEGQQGLM
ncbi:MAG: hypothetical protein PHD76_07290 [Methylacidiphilales bacterium]|nr:hypothetical protein [Candidatus Methylacidiphilales bacterium]